jgi:hypothetical protein
MGFLDDLWNGIKNFFNAVWNGILDVLNWIKDRLTDLKIAIANLLTHWMDNIGTFLLGVVVFSGLAALAVFLFSNPVIVGIMATLSQILNVIGTVANFAGGEIAIALLIEMSQTISFFNDNWLAQLEKLYNALASIASSIGADVGILIFFAEIAKVELHALNWSGIGGQYIAELQYAQGMQKWLQNLQDNLHRYTEDPEQIFFDIQKTMIEDAIANSNKQSDETLGAIAAAALWIQTTGRDVISSIDEMKSTLAGIDPRIDARINAIFKPLDDEWKKFNDTTWIRFTSEFDRITADVESGLEKQGISVDAILQKIKTPADFFSTLANLGNADKSMQAAVMHNYIDYNERVTNEIVAGKADDVTRYHNPFEPAPIPVPQYAAPVLPPTPAYGAFVSEQPAAGAARLYEDDGGADVNQQVLKE